MMLKTAIAATMAVLMLALSPVAADAAKRKSHGMRQMMVMVNGRMAPVFVMMDGHMMPVYIPALNSSANGS